jgi:membrane protein YdbS with pleckstrin-like domain
MKSQRASLNVRAWATLAILALVMGLLLFVPAGTVDYWQAWFYLAIFFGGGALLTLYLIRNDPALLERRMSGGPTAEKRAAQQVIMAATSLCFIALIVVPALDYRYGWSSVPLYGVLAGGALIVVGFYFIFLVYKENTFRRRRFRWLPISGWYQRAHMRSSGIRCTRADCCTCWARRSPSDRTGG